jgi:hypothetical protein
MTKVVNFLDHFDYNDFIEVILGLHIIRWQTYILKSYIICINIHRNLNNITQWLNIFLQEYSTFLDDLDVLEIMEIDVTFKLNVLVGGGIVFQKVCRFIQGKLNAYKK